MHSTRGLWIALIIIAGVLVGVLGGGLAWLGGTAVALAILVGAAGFAGFVSLSLAVMSFLMPPPTPSP